MKCDKVLEEYFFGTATVGDRGQVVIPTEARKKYNINSGDKVIVLGHPTGNGVFLCKIDAMREVLTDFLAHIERLDSDTSEHSETDTKIINH